MFLVVKWVGQPLLDAGLDSLGAVELHSTVQQSMGVELPSTLVFDYPNINAVAGFISETLAPEDLEQETQEQSVAQGIPGVNLVDDMLIYVTSVCQVAPPGKIKAIEQTCGSDCSAVYERADAESVAWRAGQWGLTLVHWCAKWRCLTQSVCECLKVKHCLWILSRDCSCKELGKLWHQCQPSHLQWASLLVFPAWTTARSCPISSLM